jgi:serine/threonine protein kinase
MILNIFKKINKSLFVFLFVFMSIFSLNSQLRTNEVSIDKVLQDYGYKNKGYIAKGHEAEVFKVKKGRKKYAALAYMDRDGKGLNSFERTIDFLEKFERYDSNILKPVDSIFSNRKQIIITELADSDLFNFIEDNVDISFKVAKNILIDIAHGLKTIHLSYLVHCDLKPENILIFNKKIKWFKGFKLLKKIPFTAKITDLSLVKQKDSFTIEREGTYCFMAPEYLEYCLNKKGSFEIISKLDVYAFGLIAFELFNFRRSRYSSISLFELINNEYFNGNFEFDFKENYLKKDFESELDLKEYIKESRKNIRKYIYILRDTEIINSYVSELNCPDDVKDLIKRCLDPEPESRPEMSEFLDDIYEV